MWFAVPPAPVVSSREKPLSQGERWGAWVWRGSPLRLHSRGNDHKDTGRETTGKVKLIGRCVALLVNGHAHVLKSSSEYLLNDHQMTPCHLNASVLFPQMCAHCVMFTVMSLLLGGPLAPQQRRETFARPTLGMHIHRKENGLYRLLRGGPACFHGHRVPPLLTLIRTHEHRGKHSSAPAP